MGLYNHNLQVAIPFLSIKQSKIMEVKDTAVHTKFYWQVNTDKGTEEVGYCRKQSNHGINFAMLHVGKKKKV